jgi:hypothetical protein
VVLCRRSPLDPACRLFEVIANEMKRPPESIAKMATRLGISLKPGRMSPSAPVLRPWTANEQKNLDDLLRAGKDAGEIAAALRRTRHAVLCAITTPQREANEVLATGESQLKVKSDGSPATSRQLDARRRSAVARAHRSRKIMGVYFRQPEAASEWRSSPARVPKAPSNQRLNSRPDLPSLGRRRRNHDTVDRGGHGNLGSRHQRT